MEWQLIDTAPKDEQILLASYIVPSEEAARNGSKAFWHYGIGIFLAGTWTGILVGKPSHWAVLRSPDESADICGLCGLPGADKQPHPIHWPGERAPDGDFVHQHCEQAECARAHAALTDKQREEFLRYV